MGGISTTSEAAMYQCHGAAGEGLPAFAEARAVRLVQADELDADAGEVEGQGSAPSTAAMKITGVTGDE